jgi:alpha-L-rhamnosidase
VNVGPRSLIALLSVTTADGARSYFASSVAPGAGSLAFVSTAGPVVSDNIYAGENYDARLEQPGFAACGFAPQAPWQPAVAAPDPRVVHGAVMSWQSPASAPMVDRDYSVGAITTPSDGVFVIDFGQNMAGTTTFRVVCANGPQWIYMQYGESLHPDGTVLNQ